MLAGMGSAWISNPSKVYTGENGNIIATSYAPQ
jgi:hypothetical protein